MVSSTDIEQIRQLVRQRDKAKELKEAFNGAERYSVRAMKGGNVIAEIVRLPDENVYVTEAIRQFNLNMDAAIKVLETKISAMGITP